MKTIYPLSIIITLSLIMSSFNSYENHNTIENKTFNKSNLSFSNSDTKVNDEILVDFF